MSAEGGVREALTGMHGGEVRVRVAARGERAGVRVAVAHDAAHDEVWVVECGTVRVREGVPELAALVDRAGGLGRDVAWDPAWERELAEQLAQAIGVGRDARAQLAEGGFGKGVGDDRRAAVAGGGVPGVGFVSGGVITTVLSPRATFLVAGMGVFAIVAVVAPILGSRWTEREAAPDSAALDGGNDVVLELIPAFPPTKSDPGGRP